MQNYCKIIAKLLHLCLYESKPNELDCFHLVTELSENPEFSSMDLRLSIDYDLYLYEGSDLEQLKSTYNIPDELPDNSSSNLEDY